MSLVKALVQGFRVAKLGLKKLDTSFYGTEQQSILRYMEPFRRDSRL